MIKFFFRVVAFCVLLPAFCLAEFVVKSYQELKNENMIRQNYEQSCGAASLATLLNMSNFKQFTELEILQAMNEKALNTDMVSFSQLIATLEKLGFEGGAYQIERTSLDKLVGLPLLVKIEDDPRFPHFVIIINHKGDFLQILDPSSGAYISSKREFFSLWDRDKKGGFALIVMMKNDLNLQNDEIKFNKNGISQSEVTFSNNQKDEVNFSKAPKNETNFHTISTPKFKIPQKLHFEFSPFRLF